MCLPMVLHKTILLSRHSPALFCKDPNHLLRLFKVFSESTVDKDVGLAVQECMSLVAPAYEGMSGQTTLLLEAALLENIYNVSLNLPLDASIMEFMESYFYILSIDKPSGKVDGS